jgi:hypothetical protein
MKLLLEGCVLTLVVAFWVGGLAALSDYWVAHQPRSPAGTGVTYIYACGASERVEEGGPAANTGTKGSAAGCRPYLRPHMATSRKPGVAPSERVPRGENSQQEAWQPRLLAGALGVEPKELTKAG